MLADDLHSFTHELVQGVGSGGGGREGDGGGFAVFAFDGEGLGGGVEGLERAFAGYFFAAAGVGAAEAEGEDGGESEEFFHDVAILGWPGGGSAAKCRRRCDVPGIAASPKFMPSSPAMIIRLLLCALLFLSAPSVPAHPIPDIPVRGSFTSGGAATISVEVDPRCFDADPNTAASLTFATFRTLPAARQAELRAQAAALVTRSVDFFFEPVGRVQPEFAFEFTGAGRAALAKDDDVVVLTGSWPTTIAAGLTGWKIRAHPGPKGHA